ncbi:hypothetical protein Celaphus_00012139 [Cervus elaphus hippelaphus]|uniref:WAP domain-containing protein n=1 Tax=Cervus elaphus hippelaphus TaxID=46360 RepID=A0A212CL61_CEREH|nr:hypothetical protein Celaphus_00012139 [Cervus elaphus hippelaphus]
MSQGQAVCPELSSSEKDSFTASCVNDESCPQGTKCCARSPCSRSCVVPLMGKASNPAPQRSPINWRKGGPSFVKGWPLPLGAGPTDPKLCLERSECSRDDQCRDNLKCCFSSCAMSCMVRTTGEHPGTPP